MRGRGGLEGLAGVLVVGTKRIIRGACSVWTGHSGLGYSGFGGNQA